MEDLLVLDVFWDRRLVRDSSGNEFEIFRGKDYQKDWVNLGFGYSKWNRDVFRWDKECFKKYSKQIDLATFEMIQANTAENTFYFKDANSVYIDSYMAHQAIIENAHPKNFQLLDIDNGYATSNGKDFWYGTELPYRISDMTPINESYQRVGDSIFFGHTHQIPCDSQTFEIIHPKVSTVARDKNYVYFKSEIIKGACPKTFKFMEECIADDSPYYRECDIHFYAIDKKFAYFINVPFGFKIIKTKDLSNFRFIVKNGVGYGIDSNYYYEKGRRKKSMANNVKLPNP